MATSEAATISQSTSNDSTQDNILTESSTSLNKEEPLSFKTITESGNKIRLVDSEAVGEEAPLDLFCYVRCSNQESSSVKACRGAIISEGKVLVQTFGYSPEVNASDLQGVKDLVETTDGIRVFEAHEGALLRVFHLRNKWFVSTHRKLDAGRSKWASRQSFGELFQEAINAEYENNPSFSEALSQTNTTGGIREQFFSLLNKDKCYCFLVRNTSDNRIVCKPPSRPTLYHVGTFDMGPLASDGSSFTLDNNDPCVTKPNELKFENLEEISTYCQEMNEDEFQGLIVFRGSQQVKIVNDKYAEYFSIRGNEPSIKYRYLQVRMDSEMTDKLYALYPRFTDTFEQYENVLYCIAKKIYDAYVLRFIKKQYVTVPREEYQVMGACHSWHLEDRSKNRISQRKVVEKLNEQPATALNKMIRHAQQEEQEQTLRAVRSSDSINSMLSDENMMSSMHGSRLLRSNVRSCAGISSTTSPTNSAV